MKVNNPVGSKERLKEMFERVNKIKLNETFDVPVVDDELYLDKAGDQAAEKEQPNKYDGGVDYPAIDDLKTDNPALEKITEEELEDDGRIRDSETGEPLSIGDVVVVGNDSTPYQINMSGFQGTPFLKQFDLEKNEIIPTGGKFDLMKNPQFAKQLKKVRGYKETEGGFRMFEDIENAENFGTSLDEISWAGLKGAGKYIGSEIGKSVGGAVDAVKQDVNRRVGNVQKAYQRYAGNDQIKKLQKAAQEFGNKLGTALAKYNERAVKAKQPQVTPKQIGMVILNAIDRASKQGGQANIDLSRFQMSRASEIKEGEHEWFSEDIPKNMPPVEWINKYYTFDYYDDGERFFDNTTGEEVSPEDIKSRYYSERSIKLGLEENDEFNSLEGGLADEKDPNEFDATQILKGMEVEMEHTNDPKQALEIAMDHLMEDPAYYDHLEDMEAEVDAQPDDRDDSADSLLDPSNHWIDHYSPKKLGDESVPMFEGEKKKLTENYQNTIVGSDNPMVQQIKSYLQKNYITDTEIELPNGAVVFFDYNIDDYNVTPYRGATYLQPAEGGEIKNVKISFDDIVFYDDYNNEYHLSPEALRDIENTYRGFDGKLELEIYDRISNQLDENVDTAAQEMKFKYDGDGNYIPVGYEDKKMAIRKVEQPMGSGNWKYLVVLLDNQGDLDMDAEWHEADSFEEASAILWDSIT